MSNASLQSIPDDELLRRLTELLKQSRRVESDLIAHLGEVEARRLFAREACSSMFAYCTEVLHLSEGEAYLRIGVARASRQFPVILTMLSDGRLHLSGAAKLAPHLTEANVEGVLTRAAHRTKRQIEELVSELAPKPDVPPVVRKLPVAPARPKAELRPDAVKFEMPVAVPSPPPTPRAVVAPLAPARYKVQFTASAALREKLERLQALLHQDLEAVIEASVTEKLERLEAKRYGSTKMPRKDLDQTDTSPMSRYIPAPIKRAVRERDADRCAYVDAHGRRCTERNGLEFHHAQPFGRGGDHSPENIQLMCRAHNVYLAERDYGTALMKKYRRRSEVREPRSVYGFRRAMLRACRA